MDVSFLVKRWRLRADELDNHIDKSPSQSTPIVSEMEAKKMVYLQCADQLEHELKTLDETQCETCRGDGSPMGCGECGQ